MSPILTVLSCPVFSGQDTNKYPDPYGQALKFGTFIKLFDYDIGSGLRTNVLFDLYNRLSLLMPSLVLPIRLSERRKGFTGNSFETTVGGLNVRLDDDRNNNLEENFPTSGKFSIDNQEFTYQIYAFLRDRRDKFSKSWGVIFTINGQTHGHITNAFFRRKKVQLSYLQKSILIIVDCSKLDGRAREDLFMNSRDRLSSIDLKKSIENKLEEILHEHQGLRKLKEKRRREEIEGKLDDSKPLKNVIEEIFKKSETLSKLFISGLKITSPFNTQSGADSDKFIGKKFPTFFKLMKKFSKERPKSCEITRSFRVKYETDADNEYFYRDSEAGEFTLYIDNKRTSNYSLNLFNGIANLNVTLPSSAKVGDILEVRSEIQDSNRIIPFEEQIWVEVVPKNSPGATKPGNRQNSSKDGKGKRTRPELLALPNLIEVRRGDWPQYEFNDESALLVKDSGDDGYDFFVNMDNIYLLNEKKSKNKIDPKLLDAKFKYGLALIGLSLLNNNEELEDESDKIIEDIPRITSKISPMLLPMISGLGELDEDSLESSDDEE